MAFELRLVPDDFFAGALDLASSARTEPPAPDDEPVTGVHRIEQLVERPARSIEDAPREPANDSSESGDDERIVAMLDAHRMRIEALRCELALAARVLDAIAARDLGRVMALECEDDEEKAPRTTCAPPDLGPCGAAVDSEEDEIDFPTVSALENELRATLSGIPPRRPPA